MNSLAKGYHKLPRDVSYDKRWICCQIFLVPGEAGHLCRGSRATGEELSHIFTLDLMPGSIGIPTTSGEGKRNSLLEMASVLSLQSLVIITKQRILDVRSCIGTPGQKIAFTVGSAGRTLD